MPRRAPRTPRDPREVLASLSDDQLRDLASSRSIDHGLYPERTRLIDALASQPDIPALLADADRRRAESRLERLRPRQLREIGERHRVSLYGLKKKSDLVQALAAAPSSSEILLEIEARVVPPRDVGSFFGKESDIDFDRVEDLLDQARKRFEERRFEAALEAAQEASRVAERTTLQLRRTSWSYAILAAQRLLEPCDSQDPTVRSAKELLGQARDEFLEGRLEDESVLAQLVRSAEAAHEREAERIRETLAEARDRIREVANLGGSVALAEDVWRRGSDALDRGELAASREALAEAIAQADEARTRRIREVEDSLESVADHIVLARNVGADTSDADELLADARDASRRGEYGTAGDLLKRAERLAMKAQQRQIERAIQLRQSQTERALAIIAASEPVLKEAESYDLNASEVRTLLRQARDVVMKGDYLAGVTLARNAEEAARRLGAQITEERRQRGIEKPSSGLCGVCRSSRLVFDDDGSGRCQECGSGFRWRGPLGVWERLRGLLGG
jgi:hypothetical protein